MLKGRPVTWPPRSDEARRLIGAARHPVALVSNWGSNEELEAFKRCLGEVFHCHVKRDWQPEEGERVEDDLLIKRRQEPELGQGARTVPRRWAAIPPSRGHRPGAGLGRGDPTSLSFPPRAKLIFLNSYLAPENGHADVFIPISVQTERAGHYTNFQGVVSPFEPCFAKKPAVVARGGPRSRRSPRPRGGTHDAGFRHQLVVYIAYALGLLLTLGAMLTWVERKQAAIMSDRIGANRAYLRIPFTQVKLVWLGPVPRHGRRPEAAAEGGLQATSPTTSSPTRSGLWLAFVPVMLVFAVIPFGGMLDPGQLFPGLAGLVRRPHLPDADRADRRRPADRASPSAASRSSARCSRAGPRPTSSRCWARCARARS